MELATTNLCFLKLHPWIEVLIDQTNNYHTATTTNPSPGSLFSLNLSHDQLTSTSSIKLVHNGQSNCAITPTSVIFLFCVMSAGVSRYFVNIDPLFVSTLQEKFCMSQLLNYAHFVFPLLHPSLHFLHYTLWYKDSPPFTNPCTSIPRFCAASTKCLCECTSTLVSFFFLPPQPNFLRCLNLPSDT